MKPIFLLSLFLMLLISACNKTPILDASTSMVGVWVHYTDNEDAHHIIIQSNGEGFMEWYIADKLSKQTKVRKWYLDNNILSFGKAAFNGESYTIEEYPMLSNTEEIIYYDTLYEGQRYILLDGIYYTERIE
jgi:hypothetical protein